MWTVEARAVDLQLAERFTISRESWDVASNVFVEVGYGDRKGIGEVSPDPSWGDSVEDVMAAVEGADLSALAGPFDLEGILDVLPPGPARCALDIALHDLAGRLAGVSLSVLLGVQGRKRPPTSITVPIAEPDEMLERTRLLADHPVIKTKVGFAGDVEVVARIREVFDGDLRVDANEGWTAGQAITALKELEPLGIELCEQPIPRGDHEALAEVAASTSIPVFADEDVCTAGDVAALSGVVDGVNLKLRKTGGIREALRAVATARSLGMGVMLGCDLESGVAATAQAHLCALVDHADIDGPLLLAADPCPGVAYERGRVTVPQAPGLGVKGRPW